METDTKNEGIRTNCYTALKFSTLAYTAKYSQTWKNFNNGGYTALWSNIKTANY